MKQIVLNNGNMEYLDDDYESVNLVREYLGDEIGDCLDEMLEEAYGIAREMAEIFDNAIRDINNDLDDLGVANNSSIKSIVKSVEDEIKETRGYVDFMS